MVVLSATRPTLLDVAKRLNPQGGIDVEIAEMLNERNDFWKYASLEEGNLPTGTRVTVRTSRPTPTWRKFNSGSQPGKSTTAQNVFSVGYLDLFSEVDVKIMELNGNSAAFRMSEEEPFRSALADEVVATFFYGNEALAPEEFTGLAPMFGSTTGENGQNVFVSAADGSTGDSTSIWLVGFGRQGVNLIYPKGGLAGYQFEDLGKILLENASGTNDRMMAYVGHHTWDIGLALRDWRNVSRFQFDLTTVTATGATGPVFDTTMRTMKNRIQDKSLRYVWLMNRDAIDKISLQAANKTTLGLHSIVDAQGQILDTYLGIPIARCDAILSTETAIS